MKQDQMGRYSSFSINQNHLYPLKCACNVTTAHSCFLFCSIAFSAYAQDKENHILSLKIKTFCAFVTARLFKCTKHGQLYWVACLYMLTQRLFICMFVDGISYSLFPAPPDLYMDCVVICNNFSDKNV